MQMIYIYFKLLQWIRCDMELLNYLDNTFNLFPNCNLIDSERGATHIFEKKQKKSHKLCFQCM
jgi:hypothetical protein